MNRYLLSSLVILLFSFNLKSQNLILSEYEEPPNACYQGCNDFMNQLLFDFETDGDYLYLEPAVYSGECRHNSRSYNPDQVDFAVMMIDYKPESKSSKISGSKNISQFYFSTIFSFFYEENEFANWDLATARKEMSPYWIDHGNMKRSESSTTTRVMVPYETGEPAYVYYFRQNPRTGELYYITYAGIETISFCRLKKH